MRKRLFDLINREKRDYPYTCAIVNNQRMGFLDEVEEISSIELLSIKDREGRRTYERTLAFLVSFSVKKLFPNLNVSIKHSYGDALYGEIEEEEIDEEMVSKIKNFLLEVVKADKPIEKIELTKEEAIRKLVREKRFDDIRLLKYLSREVIPIYSIDGYSAYFAGPLLPRTGMLKVFDLVSYPPGFLIILPEREDPFKLSKVVDRRKLFETFQESKRWIKTLEIMYVGDLNETIVKGEVSRLIKVQEALHEKKISDIADRIKERKAKVVLIAGPSSSGKTTFAKKLEIHLRVNELKPLLISTDNYFVDREKTPIGEDGKPDYETIEALNYRLLQDHIEKLLSKEEVILPRYNFITGKSEKWKKVYLPENGILMIEGIHGLNPKLTERIPEEKKFKIYVSALTQLNIDRINRIPTRDTRLIRRIVRDAHFRGIPAIETIRRWQGVIRGEEKYIFPYQENADVMFNSALVYELSILRTYAEVSLRTISYNKKEYSEALRLLIFLYHFVPLTPDEVPPTSILREFIGGSAFKY